MQVYDIVNSTSTLDKTRPVLTDATVDHNSTFQGSTVMYTCDTGSEYQSVDISLVCTGGV